MPKERKTAQKKSEFDASEFNDRYEEALRELIESKKKGHRIVPREERKPSNVINLMDALKASLKGDGVRNAGTKPVSVPKRREKR